MISRTLTTLVSIAFALNLTAQSSITIQPTSSHIEWHAEKVTGSHHGTVHLLEGSMKIQGNELHSGEFIIDMSSIECEDLSGGSKAKLENHLKSPDFFDVQNHPNAKFVITSVKQHSEDPAYNKFITGDLSIKGITHSISFPARVEVKDAKLAAYGEMTIDRTKYNVRYGSASFFSDLGDKAIMDEFTLKINLGAK